MRVGIGYDVHKLVENRKLILGGVEIPHTLGLLGHSDADVGKHFPDTDEQYKGISSIRLLEYVRELIEKEGYLIENIDATVIAQKPKLRPYIDQMQENIANALKIEKNQVNVKATTEERLGFTGREEGISSQAICALSSLYENSVMVSDSTGGCCGGCQRG